MPRTQPATAVADLVARIGPILLFLVFATVLAEHEGTTVDYAVNLWWRTFG